MEKFDVIIEKVSEFVTFESEHSKNEFMADAINTFVNILTIQGNGGEFYLKPVGEPAQSEMTRVTFPFVKAEREGE